MVNYWSADGWAKFGKDYVAATGSLSFAPGDTSKTVTVLVNGDSVNEPDETFFVNLSGAVNSTVSKAQGAGTIKNKDAVHTSELQSLSKLVCNTLTAPAVFTVSLAA